VTGPALARAVRAVEDRWSRYWFAFEVPAATLRRFRALFFGLVAVDAWMQVAHAPRYGAGGFNVSHLPGLDGLMPMPGRTLMLLVYLLQSYLAARIALGATARWMTVSLAGLFGYSYFVSQLNSYQHHYLLFLLLALAGAVPWPSRSPDGGAPVRSWAVRLMIVQLSVLYAWTTVAKLDAQWLSGSVLAGQVPGGWGRELIQHWGAVGASLGDLGSRGEGAAWAGAARTVVAVEAFLAIAIQVPALRGAAFVAGMGLHLSIEALGFQIGMFSWFMVAVYALVVPGQLSRWAAALSLGTITALMVGGYGQPLTRVGDPVVLLYWFAVFVHLLLMPEPWRRHLTGLAAPAGPASRWLVDRINTYPSAAWLALAAVVLAGAALTASLPFAIALHVAWITAAIAIFLALPSQTPTARVAGAFAHMLACGLVVVLNATTDQARDHFQYWGGDARRRGELDAAVAAYERVRDLAPTYATGRRRLGDLYRRTGRDDQALREYLMAASLDPSDYLSYLGQALIHDRAGRGDDTLKKVIRALELVDAHRQTAASGAQARARASDRRRLLHLFTKWRRAEGAMSQ
jgi:hypothetical protein